MKKVIYIDDDMTLNYLLANELRVFFDIDAFSDPETALAFIQKNHNDIGIVLCDHKMPSISGLTLLAQVSQINPAIKRVLITGYYDLVQNKPGLENCDLILQKSAFKNIDELADQLRAIG